MKIDFPVEFNQFDSVISTPLRDIQFFAHPDLPEAIGLVNLVFETGIVLIQIETEFDTLSLSTRFEESHQTFTIKLGIGAYRSILGKILVNAWKMTNDRGYFDSIQLRLRENAINAGSYTYLQFYAEASQIAITQLKSLDDIGRVEHV